MRKLNFTLCKVIAVRMVIYRDEMNAMKIVFITTYRVYVLLIIIHFSICYVYCYPYKQILVIRKYSYVLFFLPLLLLYNATEQTFEIACFYSVIILYISR